MIRSTITLFGLILFAGCSDADFPQSDFIPHEIDMGRSDAGSDTGSGIGGPFNLPLSDVGGDAVREGTGGTDAATLPATLPSPLFEDLLEVCEESCTNPTPTSGTVWTVREMFTGAWGPPNDEGKMRGFYNRTYSGSCADWRIKFIEDYYDRPMIPLSPLYLQVQTKDHGDTCQARIEFFINSIHLDRP